jgi:hypothetical protein
MCSYASIPTFIAEMETPAPPQLLRPQRAPPRRRAVGERLFPPLPGGIAAPMRGATVPVGKRRRAGPSEQWLATWFLEGDIFHILNMCAGIYFIIKLFVEAPMGRVTRLRSRYVMLWCPFYRPSTV